MLPLLSPRLAMHTQLVPRKPLACGGRAADVLAETYTVCYTLSRKAFNELLGPIEDMWRFEALRKARPPRPGFG